jgi:ribonuclease HI
LRNAPSFATRACVRARARERAGGLAVLQTRQTVLAHRRWAEERRRAWGTGRAAIVAAVEGFNRIDATLAAAVRRGCFPASVARKNTPPVILDEGALSVFVDGSMLAGPRRGGIGIRFVYTDELGHETPWDSPQTGVEGASIQQMELLAVITALEEMQQRRFPAELLVTATKVVIYSDSRYVVDNVGTAMHVWPKQKWMTRDGRPVQNAELWKRLVRELGKLSRIKRVDIKWAAGHSPDNPHNNAVDALAKASARTASRPPLVPVSVRRKTTTEVTKPGSVGMHGQRLQVRIITAEPMRTQRTNRYRYEVASPTSAYCGMVDFAYSDDPMMRPGHTYVVTMNRNQGYPQIVKCLREIPREE